MSRRRSGAESTSGSPAEGPGSREITILATDMR